MSAAPIARRAPTGDLSAANPNWQPRLPELACVANAVSLLMPHAEPYVIRSVRRALTDASAEPVSRFLAQEAEHHRAHREYNRAVAARHPGAVRIERAIKRTIDWLERNRSAAFGAAFAAGFETVAYATARWVERHRRELFDGADPTVSKLFIWHLAEEVEHKSVAHDAYQALGKRRLGYIAAMIASLAVLATFTVAGSLYFLARERRIWHPITWFRLVWWSMSYSFELLPTMAVSVMTGHHPDQLADPEWYRLWLDEHGQVPHPQSGAVLIDSGRSG